MGVRNWGDFFHNNNDRHVFLRRVVGGQIEIFGLGNKCTIPNQLELIMSFISETII